MVPAGLQLPELLTWYEDGDRSLHSSADDVVHSKHPVRFNVMVPQDLIHLTMYDKFLSFIQADIKDTK